MKTFFGNRLVNAIAIAIVTVLVIVVLSVWQYQRIRDSGVIIRHSNALLLQSEKVQRTATQFEVNVKNFLLTGDSSFLDTAGRVAALLPPAIDSLRLLVVGDSVQRSRIDSLQFYVDGNRNVLERAMRLSKGGEFGGAATLINAEARTGYSHRIESMIEELETGQRRFLETRRTANQQKATQLQWALWILTGAVVGLGVIVFRKFSVDLKHEREERLSTEDKYKMLFDKSPLPKWIYDEETLRFLEVNGTALRDYGYSRDEFLAMSIADIRPFEDLDRLRMDLENVRSQPGSYKNGQWRHQKKNGEIIDVEVVAHPIDYEGHSARMVVVRNITDRRRYEEQLRRLNTDLSKRAVELSASNAELERFAYIASHDLQEPLRMVSSFLQLLQKRYSGQLDAKADQYIHYAVDGAERMKALIMDLLEYSRVGTGKENFTPVDTAVVVQEVGEIFHEKIIAARAQVEIATLPVVTGDKVQLTQLFQNLLSNALKYHSDKPPIIRIGVQEEAAHWQFSVADNGIGIDPQFFDKIFIIFQRLHNKTDYSGTGIGLAICKKIVERHGGRIWVESLPQQGSTFYFTIHKKG
jgi:two-component system CheB/CheR fusion protein